MTAIFVLLWIPSVQVGPINYGQFYTLRECEAAAKQARATPVPELPDQLFVCVERRVK